MPIITISHSAFGGGRVLGEKVASILDHRCISREVLLEASRRYGIPETKFSEVLETEPRWWERWLESLRLYRITLQAGMCEIAQGGNLVYHGYGGQELFPGIRHVLKAFLAAPMEYRIEQVKARKKLDEEAARQYLNDLDRIRARRLKAIFGVDWRDPSRYDLVLNISHMSVETAAHLVVEAVQRAEYQPTDESKQAFEDLTVTSRVQAALITSQNTRNLNLNVKAEKGQVSVWGTVDDAALEAEIIRIVKDVPGVAKVFADIRWLPIDYTYTYP